MEYKKTLLSLVLIIITCFYGCDRLWPDCYWSSERYVLLAIDTKSQMSLCFDLENGTAMGLVDPTVFSIGANSNYIVVKQHPPTKRSITNYFIVERNQSPNSNERQKGVRGPMGKDEFDKLSKTLSLPDFSKTFDDLK